MVGGVFAAPHGDAALAALRGAGRADIAAVETEPVMGHRQQMQRLPGVGRKTANVLGAVLWQKEVMPVDTHVFRVSERIGLTTRSKTPLQTELALEKNIPGHLLPLAHHWLILHGRYVCTARAPKCESCGLNGICKESLKSFQK